MQQHGPDPEVLHLGDHRAEIFLGAHDDHVGDRVVPGQRGEVLADLGLDAFLTARPGFAQAELEAGDVGQCVVLGNSGALGRRVVPVTAQ